MSEEERFKIADPHWERTLRPGPAPLVKLGDPTRWGASELTILPQVGAALTFSSGRQIVYAKTSDPYSRPWAVAGNFAITRANYITVGPASPLAPYPYNITPLLEVTMGVGQAQFTQLYDVRALVQISVGNYETAPGNPTGVYRVGDSGQRNQIPFWLSGIVGTSVSIRAIYAIKDATLILNDPDVTMTLALNPYNAGSGL